MQRDYGKSNISPSFAGSGNWKPDPGARAIRLAPLQESAGTRGVGRSDPSSVQKRGFRARPGNQESRKPPPAGSAGSTVLGLAEVPAAKRSGSMVLREVFDWCPNPKNWNRGSGSAPAHRALAFPGARRCPGRSTHELVGATTPAKDLPTHLSRNCASDQRLTMPGLPSGSQKEPSVENGPSSSIGSTSARRMTASGVPVFPGTDRRWFE